MVDLLARLRGLRGVSAFQVDPPPYYRWQPNIGKARPPQYTAWHMEPTVGRKVGQSLIWCEEKSQEWRWWAKRVKFGGRCSTWCLVRLLKRKGSAILGFGGVVILSRRKTDSRCIFDWWLAGGREAKPLESGGLWQGLIAPISSLSPIDIAGKIGRTELGGKPSIGVHGMPGEVRGCHLCILRSAAFWSSPFHLSDAPRAAIAEVPTASLCNDQDPQVDLEFLLRRLSAAPR